eukprot:5149857-Pleurochrysis_carterae.AAC.2
MAAATWSRRGGGVRRGRGEHVNGRACEWVGGACSGGGGEKKKEERNPETSAPWAISGIARSRPPRDASRRLISSGENCKTEARTGKIVSPVARPPCARQRCMAAVHAHGRNRCTMAL